MKQLGNHVDEMNLRVDNTILNAKIFPKSVLFETKTIPCRIDTFRKSDWSVITIID